MTKPLCLCCSAGILTEILLNRAWSCHCNDALSYPRPILKLVEQSRERPRRTLRAMEDCPFSAIADSIAGWGI